VTRGSPGRLSVGLIPNYEPEHERVARAVPHGADQHQERAPHEFPVGHPYGTDFVYDEMMVAPRFGEIARVTTETFATMVSLFGTGGLKPGAGPTRKSA